MTPKPYHHGRLREVLLVLAMGLIETDGVEALSLRKLAKLAGVSPSAPYRHFKSKSELLEALALAGIRKMREGFETRPGVEPLRALGEAYVAFGVSHPNLYRLMFANSCIKSDDSEAHVEGKKLFDVLIESVRRGLGQSDPPADLVARRATIAWSLVHGFVMLTIDGEIERAGLEVGDPELVSAALEMELVVPRS